MFIEFCLEVLYRSTCVHSCLYRYRCRYICNRRRQTGKKFNKNM